MHPGGHRRLNWNGLVRDDLRRCANDRAAWEALYDELVPTLQLAETLLRLEVEAFSTESGKDRLALWSVRRKTRTAFVDKMCNIAAEPDRYDAKFREARTGALSIFDLVTDAVGGRLVFYFERDIQEALLFWLGYPAYQPREVTHWVQDLSGYDTALPAASWLRAVPGITRQPKQSGYESLHIVLRFVPEILQCRFDIWRERPTGDHRFRWQEVSEDRFREQRDRLGQVTFEIQCRTILEHTWAEVEHKARYAPVKAHQGTVEDASEQMRTFRNYKAILRAAQMFQNSIRTGFARWDSGDNAIVGRFTSLDVGPRDGMWPEKAREQIAELNAVMSDALVAARQGLSARGDEAWNGAVDRFEQTLRSLGGDGSSNLLHVHPGLDVEEYGRRRLLVMLLGFLLAYAWVPERRYGENDARNPRRRASDLFLTANLPPEARAWIPPRVAAVRLYEHLRILDEWYARKFQRPLFRDPLVVSRAASVHYRHFGSFRRASKLWSEALEKLREWSVGQPPGALVMTQTYLGRRIAEAHWTAYHLEGRQAEDLQQALAAARQALAAVSADVSAHTDLGPTEEKLLALLLTMTLYDAAARLEGGPRLIGGERGWAILREAWKTLQDDAPRFRSRLDPAEPRLATSSLRLQGVAIGLACSALDVGDEPDAQRRLERDRLLVAARRQARAARQRMEERLRAKRGGALPFHLTVSREVEAFVFSLCTDDCDVPAVRFAPTDESVSGRTGRPRRGGRRRVLRRPLAPRDPA